MVDTMKRIRGMDRKDAVAEVAVVVVVVVLVVDDDDDVVVVDKMHQLNGIDVVGRLREEKEPKQRMDKVQEEEEVLVVMMLMWTLMMVMMHSNIAL